MKAFELAATLELNVAAGNLKEGGFSDQAAAELRRLAAVNAELVEALQLTLTLAVMKFGNLDKDANTIFDQARNTIAKAKEQQ